MVSLRVLQRWSAFGIRFSRSVSSDIGYTCLSKPMRISNLTPMRAVARLSVFSPSSHGVFQAPSSRHPFVVTSSSVQCRPFRLKDRSRQLAGLSRTNGHVKTGVRNAVCAFSTGVETGNSSSTVGDGVSQALRVALICGGPSPERGISLNSARSLLDHLDGSLVDISAYYIDTDLVAHSISPSQLYSNTPSDFDFRLRNKSVSGVTTYGSLCEFGSALKSSADLVFPVMHGKYGEDGQIQKLLEENGIPFVGTGSKEAAMAFDKYNAAQALKSMGFDTLPSLLVDGVVDKASITQWFQQQGLDVATGRAVVKPTRAGSSVGVSVVLGVDECMAHVKGLLQEGIDSRVMIEAYAVGGREFTTIVLQGPEGPVALIPSEVELRAAEAGDEDAARAIFSYRRKYLPTQQVCYHTPPRFPVAATTAIRTGVADVFARLGLRDFARVDGFYIAPSASGDPARLIFSDINIISGMEQTSFLFQQAAAVGLSHAAILRHIVAAACHRHHITHPWATFQATAGNPTLADPPKRGQVVRVLFGGGTSERQ
mmetsp:Transcript_35081/g.76681  ORF Transcript_35081/g.76681 Transcript_35081/m.76681 type:complete len:541 (+) Transcript_35081:177-1799(+)